MLYRKETMASGAQIINLWTILKNCEDKKKKNHSIFIVLTQQHLLKYYIPCIPVETEYKKDGSPSSGGKQSHSRFLILIPERTRAIFRNTV